MASKREPGTMRRLWQIRRIVKQYDLAGLVEEFELTGAGALLARLAFGRAEENASRPRGQRLREALEALGPVYIKFGQALSTRPDLLPQDIAGELTKLQDQVPPFDTDQALQIIKQCYGDQTEKIFAHIDPLPLASASVAQVHAAELQPGLALMGKNEQRNDQVIIKILRPGVEQAVENDLRLMFKLASLLQKFWPRAQQFKPTKIVEEYAATIRGELDLRLEAANCSLMGANFSHTDIIYVPLVYWDYTHRNVLVMERIYGTSVREVDKLKALGYDLQRLANDGVNTFFKQAFEDNFFHADMHPGNIFVCDKGKWIAIDFGIMGVLGESDKRYLAEMLLGFFNRDYRSIAESHLRAGWVPAHTQVAEFEAAIRMVCEPNFAKPIAEISFGKVLMELIHTVQRFEMPVQPQLILLYKTLLQIEGLGRQLYPQLNLWDTAKPFLENWMKQQMSPQALLRDIKHDWPRWRELLSDLPDYMKHQRERAKNAPQHLLALQNHSEELRKTRRARFHHLLGFGCAFTALALAIAAHSGVISTVLADLWLTVFGTAGVAWAFWHSR